MGLLILPGPLALHSLRIRNPSLFIYIQMSIDKYWNAYATHA